MTDLITLSPDGIRREYGTGSQRVRLSIQEDILNAMNEIGMIKFAEGTSMKRGGNGSAFLQLSALLMIGTLYKGTSENIYAAEAIRRILHIANSIEDLEVIIENLRAITYDLEDYTGALMGGRTLNDLFGNQK